jgi:Glycosyl transferase family 11
MRHYKKQKTRRGRRQRRTRRRTRIQRGGQQDRYVFVEISEGHGMGNQICFYAAGYTASKKTGLPLCMLCDSPEGSKQYRTLFDGKVSSKAEMGERVKRAHLLLPETPNTIGDFAKKWSADDLDYKPDLHTGDVRMPFQYYQYVPPLEAVAADLKAMFTKNEFHKEKYRKYDTQINPADSAFMHVRRGDYTKLNWAPKDEFYVNTVKELTKNGTIKTIYVLSNDIQWCNDQLPKWKENTSKAIEILDIPDELESLYAMMRCAAGAATPCSSFSLWGTLLGANMNPTSTIVYSYLNPIGGMNLPNPQNVPARWIGI